MANEDRPAMPWYVKDWLVSVDRHEMTYEQRGVYRDLLDQSWLERGIPADLVVLGRMLGLSPQKFSVIWRVIGKHWYEEEGRLYNGKQERVRAHLNGYTAGRRAAGKKGSDTRWRDSKPDGKPDGKTIAKPSVCHESATDPPIANGWLAADLPIAKPIAKGWPAFAFASPKEILVPPEQQESTPSEVPVVRPPPAAASALDPAAVPLVMSPLRYDKRKQRCAFVGSRLEVPNQLHADLRRALGGLEADTTLLAWYQAIDEEIEGTGEVIPDVFPWLQQRFKVWAQDVQFKREMEKFRPKEA